MTRGPKSSYLSGNWSDMVFNPKAHLQHSLTNLNPDYLIQFATTAPPWPTGIIKSQSPALPVFVNTPIGTWRSLSHRSALGSTSVAMNRAKDSLLKMFSPTENFDALYRIPPREQVLVPETIPKFDDKEIDNRVGQSIAKQITEFAVQGIQVAASCINDKQI